MVWVCAVGAVALSDSLSFEIGADELIGVQVDAAGDEHGRVYVSIAIACVPYDGIGVIGNGLEVLGMDIASVSGRGNKQNKTKRQKLQ